MRELWKRRCDRCTQGWIEYVVQRNVSMLGCTRYLPWRYQQCGLCSGLYVDVCSEQCGELSLAVRHTGPVEP